MGDVETKGNQNASIAKRLPSAEDGDAYSAEEQAFLKAVEAFKKKARVRFPSNVDLFRVAKQVIGTAAR